MIKVLIKHSKHWMMVEDAAGQQLFRLRTYDMSINELSNLMPGISSDQNKR